MSNIDRLRVGGTDYDIQSVVKVYDTIADMNADIANIPNGATVFVKENSPSGLEGDDELDPTSSNWVKNSAIAEAISTLSSDLTAHTLEAGIDISSYTAWGSPYICPKDGYIYIIASAANSYVYAYVHQQSVATIHASAIYSDRAASNIIPVRKGMKIVISGSGTFAAAFHGLS